MGFGIQVVGKGPEQSDDKYVKDPDPQEENYTLAGPRDAEGIKQQEIGHKNQRDPGDQADAAHPRSESSIGRNNGQQKHSLRRSRIRLHLGPALRQDQRFPHRFQQVVAHQQQKGVQSQQEDVGALTGPHIRQEGQHPFRDAFGAGIGRGDRHVI